MSDAQATAEEAITNPTEGTPKVAGTENQTAAASLAETSAVAEKETVDEKKDEPANIEKHEESSKESNGDSQKNGHGDERNGNRQGRDQARGHHRSHNQNSNFRYQKSNYNEYEKLPETDDPVEILSQLEFYFTPSNLASDEHMFLESGGPKNYPVSLKHITSFKRMVRFKPYSAVVAAVGGSETLELVDDGEFSGAGNEAVRRKTPITVSKKDGDDENEPTTKELFLRYKRDSADRLDASIYAKNFGADDVGQIEIEKFFKPYGSVAVRKRREEDGKWKGSVFVEFDSVQMRDDFLALDPIPKFNGNDLYVQGKREYNEMKCKEKGIDPQQWNQISPESHYGRARGGGHGGGRGGGRGRGRGRGGNDRGRSDRDGFRKGRYNDRNNDRSRRHDNRRRNHSRSRSPRRNDDDSRPRSRSPRRNRDRSGSRDGCDWKESRDRFQKRGYKDRRNDPPPPRRGAFSVDENGVPIIRDTRGEPDHDPQNNGLKRKAGDGERPPPPKKWKIEFKEDA